MAIILFRGANLAMREGVVKLLENLACLSRHLHWQRALGIQPFDLSA
jgi:hypothetical protein